MTRDRGLPNGNGPVKLAGMGTNIALVALLLGAFCLFAKTVAWAAGMEQTSVHKGSKQRATEQLRRNHSVFGAQGGRYSLGDRQLRRKFRDEFRGYYDAECKAQGF